LFNSKIIRLLFEAAILREQLNPVRKGDIMMIIAEKLETKITKVP
jgi:ribosomal protein S28E/S33